MGLIRKNGVLLRKRGDVLANNNRCCCGAEANCCCPGVDLPSKLQMTFLKKDTGAVIFDDVINGGRNQDVCTFSYHKIYIQDPSSPPVDVFTQQSTIVAGCSPLYKGDNGLPALIVYSRLFAILGFSGPYTRNYGGRLTIYSCRPFYAFGPALRNGLSDEILYVPPDPLGFGAHNLQYPLEVNVEVRDV